MKEVIVHVEEHLLKEIKVQVDTDNMDDAMDIAQQHVLNMYNDNKIILTADDHTTTLFHAECDGYDTEWKEDYRLGDDTYSKEKLEQMCTIVE